MAGKRAERKDQMAIELGVYKRQVFKEIERPDYGKYRVKFAGPLEPGDQEIVMKADIAIEDLSKDIVYPVVRYPQKDAPKGPQTKSNGLDNI